LESQVAPEAMILSGCFGWAKKEIVELAMGRKKSLSLSRGFEALHDPLASSGRLVRILRPIVKAFVLAMFDAGHDRAPVPTRSFSRLIQPHVIQGSASV